MAADGISDIAIGADLSNNKSGQTYVVFGTNNGFSSLFNLTTLDGNNGFVAAGSNPGDFSGSSLSPAGDLNDDGVNDLIVGAEGTSSRGIQGYVIYGNKSGFTPMLNFSNLNGVNGFTILNNQDSFECSDVSSIGDLNGDGINDIAISTFDSNNMLGQSYVIFGQQSDIMD